MWLVVYRVDGRELNGAQSDRVIKFKLFKWESVGVSH